jgi:hypothetical protein
VIVGAGCSDPVPAPSAPDCVVDTDCDVGRVCLLGECQDPSPTEGEGEGAEGEGEGEGEGEPPRGILTVLPERFVEFGAVRLGVPVERSVTLKNTGTAALTILQIVLDDDDEGAFTVDPTGSLDVTLAPDDEFALLLVYRPADGVPDDAELKILHTGEGQLTSVPLSAEFKGDSRVSVTTSALELSPDMTAYDFGTVAVGDSRSVTLFIRNDGAADSVLTVAAATLAPQNVGIAVQAALSAPVALSAWAGACLDVDECPAVARACTGGACVDASGHPLDAVVVTVTFAPQQTQLASATLSIRTDAGGLADSVHDITFTGTGAAGELSVTPSPVSFDEVFVGFPQRQSVRIKNIGGAALTLTGATLENAGSIFALDALPTFPVTLSPDDELPLEVVCTPAGVVQTSNTIRWAVSGVAQPPTTRVQANTRLPPELGVYDEARTKLDLPSADPTARVDFGDVYVGRPSSRSFKLVNDGALQSTLTVRRLTIDGPQAERFSVTTNAIDVALPGNLDLAPSRDLTVHYQPQQLTGFPDTATLTIESDDPARPTVELQLTGRGIRPVLNVSTTALDFGRVLAGGTPATRTFTVTNLGAGPLLVTGFTAPSLPVFAVVSTSTALPATLQPLVVDPNSVLTVTVRYAPTVADQISQSTLAVQSTDFDRGDVLIDLVGTSGGCPARANASVVVNGDQCVYTCNAGTHACGDACLADDSPDSCGTSCSPCQIRDNALRGCTAATSTCTYTCEPDARDLDNTLNAAQNTSSNGCEYQCPVFPTTTETCTGLDEDCDGKIDEGLNADEFDRNSTSSAASTTKNSNDACTAADVIPNVTEGPASNPGTNTINATIYPMPAIGGDDEDWYKVTLVELSNNPFENPCIPFLDREFYRATFRLTGIPAGSDYDLSIHPADSTCSTAIFTGCSNFTSGAAGPAECSSDRGGNADEGFNADYTGRCGVDDNFSVLVRVKRFAGGSCDDYQLTVSFAAR